MHIYQAGYIIITYCPSLRGTAQHFTPAYKRTHIFRQCLTFWLVLQDMRFSKVWLLLVAYEGKTFFYYRQKKEKGQPVWCHTHQRKLPKSHKLCTFYWIWWKLPERKRRCSIFWRNRGFCVVFVCLFCFSLVSSAPTQREGPGFESSLEPFWVAFARGSVRVLKLPPTVQRQAWS